MSRLSAEEFQRWLEGQQVRYARAGKPKTLSADAISRYLPSNYQVIEDNGENVIIAGADVAGWTMEDYVIPRLQSGLIVARELRTVKVEVYHNISRDSFFGLNAVFESDGEMVPKGTKREARTDEEKHPLVKVFEYRTYCDGDAELCERAFAAFNNGSGHEDPRYFDRKLRSLSVGDVITIDGEPYSCEHVGFRQRDRSDLRIAEPGEIEAWGGAITVPWEVK